MPDHQLKSTNRFIAFPGDIKFFDITSRENVAVHIIGGRKDFPGKPFLLFLSPEMKMPFGMINFIRRVK